MFEEFEDRNANPPVRGFLHRPEQSSGALVLTHGAGSNCKAPLLVALADAFSAAGFTVLRCDLPYRQVRSFGPPRPGDAERDREGLRNAVDALRTPAPGKLYLGGQSYGGRQATMMVAENPHLVAGMLLLSYPLHAPSRPDQLRTQHLPKLQAPALFVHGTRDPFGSIQEMEAALKLIPAKTKLLPVEGAGHDLGFGKKSAGKMEDLPRRVLAAFEELMI
jgi:predicted alpha/beta-hydrolase family hydrolase